MAEAASRSEPRPLSGGQMGESRLGLHAFGEEPTRESTARCRPSQERPEHDREPQDETPADHPQQAEHRGVHGVEKPRRIWHLTLPTPRHGARTQGAARYRHHDDAVLVGAHAVSSAAKTK
jgi:hypothetical protein